MSLRYCGGVFGSPEKGLIGPSDVTEMNVGSSFNQEKYYEKKLQCKDYEKNRINDLKEKINSKILEDDPYLYHQNLMQARWNPLNSFALKIVINDTSDEFSYNSPSITQLSYLVGNFGIKESDIISKNFYGKKTTISDNLGCLILDELIAAGADIYIENFYEYNVKESLSHTHTLTYRKNNVKFKKKVNQLFIYNVNKKSSGKGLSIPTPPLAG